MITNIISATVLALFFYGRSLWNKNLKLHIKLMFIVIIADTAMVLYLAVFKRVLSEIKLEMSTLLYVHIAFALTTVILYFIMIPYGMKLKENMEDPVARAKLKFVDRVLVLTRVCTFITSVTLYIEK